MKQNNLNDTNTFYKLADDLLNDEHNLSFRLKGNSMFPVLREGDVAIVRIVRPESLKKGDVVVVKTNKGLVGHRIIRIETDGKLKFYTRGDNSPNMDAPFGVEMLLGKINQIERSGKKKKINIFSGIIRATPNKTQHKLHLKLNKLYFSITNLFLKLKSVRTNLRLITENSVKELSSNIVVAVLQGIFPFLLIICLKYLTDFITSPDAVDYSILAIYLIVTAITFFLSGILTEVRSFTSEELSHSVNKNIYRKLHEKHSVLDISYYENPEEQNKIHRAVQEASYRPMKIINGLLNGIKSIVSAVFLAGIFVSIKWYLLLVLVVAIIPELLVRIKFARKYYQLKTSQSAAEREMFYHNRVLTGFPFAKEQKLFGFSSFFLGQFNILQNKLFLEKNNLRKSEIRLLIFTLLFAVLLIFGALAFVAAMKLDGLISIGTVVLFLFAFQRGYSVLNELFRSFTQMVEDNTYLNDLIAFLYLSPVKKADPIPDKDFSLKKEIKIENLSFGYETSQRPALINVNVIIPAGKTVALVGSNGSGKSTLIKLLCGFYQPDEGKISIDGVNVSAIGGEKIRQNISAVFQDFALYNVSALNNILLGRLEKNVDMEKLKKAAEAAGIAEVLENLPNGYDTLLGNLFTDAEELSIGQWQKMAIARAFYRDAPLLLLDEPSSALDVQSEKKIIETLKELSKNKTAVIVSHRMSTVQWADFIYLFENGEVKESGSHTELIQLNGRYAELYRISRDIEL
jgi:ATP-binding cassette, subfamily B, bacterial